jgi:hypothetical protein
VAFSASFPTWATTSSYSGTRDKSAGVQLELGNGETQHLDEGVVVAAHKHQPALVEILQNDLFVFLAD